MPDDTPAFLPAWVQHFVSKKYGRASITLSFDVPPGALVTIAFAAPGIAAQQFRADVAAFTRHCCDAAVLPETIARSAIARLHKGDVERDPALPLLPEVRPWLGDFSAGPPTAGTATYRRRSAATEERRQADGSVSACVELALQMRQSEGRERVRSFLLGERVPPSVIRRVLSNAASRRQFRRGTT